MTGQLRRSPFFLVFLLLIAATAPAQEDERAERRLELLEILRRAEPIPPPLVPGPAPAPAGEGDDRIGVYDLDTGQTSFVAPEAPAGGELGQDSPLDGEPALGRATGEEAGAPSPPGPILNAVAFRFAPSSSCCSVSTSRVSTTSTSAAPLPSATFIS